MKSALELVESIYGDQNSHKESMNSQGVWKLTESMKFEYEPVIFNNTCELLSRTCDEPFISRKWVYKVKYERKYDDCIGTSYKERLIARRVFQVGGLD